MRSGGADPITEITPWSTTATIVGLLSLQILTSLAVMRFFQGDHRSERWMTRVLAPGSAIAGLLGVLFLMLGNIDKLTGLDWMGNAVILLPLIIGFIYGVFRTRHTIGQRGADVFAESRSE